MKATACIITMGNKAFFRLPVDGNGLDSHTVTEISAEWPPTPPQTALSGLEDRDTTQGGKTLTPPRLPLFQRGGLNMEYKPGDTAYIIESGWIIREVIVIRVAGEMYTLKFTDTDGSVKLRGEPIVPVQGGSREVC